jgi:GH24 family phage-related lysozyme (muramidase)
MRMIPNAGAVARRAFSMWCNYAGIAALIAPEVIYAVAGIDTNPRIWFWLGLGLIVAGIVGRITDQGIDNPKDARFFSSGAAMLIAMAALFPRETADPEPTGKSYTIQDFDAVAVPLIAKWEGLRTTAYLDTIASPPVWTVCYGETKGVRQGDSYSEAQCRDMLAREVRSYRDGLHRYFTPETRTERLTAHRDAAYTSLAYNVGIAGAGKSTATRRLNAGDIAGGCEAIGWWNRAGDRIVRGLVNRRADEVALCLRGLT